MLLCGGGNAGNKILQDGDSGWQRCFLLLRGPRHGVWAGAGGLIAAPAAPSRLLQRLLGRAGWGAPRHLPGEDSIAPSPLHPHNRIISPPKAAPPSLAVPFAERSASPAPGGCQRGTNTVTSPSLTHLHALGIEGGLRAWSCFGRFLLGVGFLERHRAGVCGGAG